MELDFQKILSPVNPGFVGANYGVDFQKNPLANETGFQSVF
jgi:hypothetical protein